MSDSFLDALSAQCAELQLRLAEEHLKVCQSLGHKFLKLDEEKGRSILDTIQPAASRLLWVPASGHEKQEGDCQSTCSIDSVDVGVSWTSGNSGRDLGGKRALGSSEHSAVELLPGRAPAWGRPPAAGTGEAAGPGDVGARRAFGSSENSKVEMPGMPRHGSSSTQDTISMLPRSQRSGPAPLPCKESVTTGSMHSSDFDRSGPQLLELPDDSAGEDGKRGKVRFGNDDSDRRAVSPMSCAEDGRNSGNSCQDVNFELALAWKQSNTCLTRGGTVSGLQHKGSINRNGTNVSELMTDSTSYVSAGCNHIFRRLVIVPHGRFPISWSFFWLALFLWDVMTVPLSVFDPPEVLLTTALLWMGRIFWTADFFVSALMGYADENGVLVTNPKLTVVQYARQFMVLDIICLVAMWAEIGQGPRAYFLPVRMFRLFKGRELLGMLVEHIRSERLAIIVVITRLLFIFIILSHLIACTWFWIGTFGQQNLEEDWIDAHGLHKLSVLEYYMHSSRNAVMMFFGNNAIPPSNQLELTFVVFALCAAFMIQIWFVSSMTTAMTRFEIISTRRSNLFSALNAFLCRNGISMEVSLKVRRNAQCAFDDQETDAPESSVELLKLISDPLLMELHFEIYFDAICVQPFFRCYNQVNPVGMRKVCHCACRQFSLSKDDILFQELETNGKPSAFFVLSGLLDYKRQMSDEPQEVTTQDWAAEPSLWVDNWMHWGTLRSKAENTRVLALDAQKFQAAVGSFASTHISAYAEAVIHRLNRYCVEEQTDIGWYDSDLGDMLNETFPVEWPEIGVEFGYTNRKQRMSHFTNKSQQSLTQQFADLLPSRAKPLERISRAVRHSVQLQPSTQVVSFRASE